MMRRTAAVLAVLWLTVGSGAWRASAASPTHSGAPPDSTAGHASEPAPALPPLRLPRTLLPQANRATLVLDPTHDTFAGHLTMEARVAAPLRVFWLHAEHLIIDAATLSAGGERWALAVLPPAPDVIGFRSAREIPTGLVTLDIAYRGRMQATETKGLFRQHEGADWYLFTHFEPLGARRVYPCVDEPDSKIPWQLTLEVPHTLVAVSNTPVVSDTLTDRGTRRVAFRETPPLPSYLVAFAVGPFAVVDAGTTRTGTPLRVIVPQGRGGDVGYVVEHTAPLLAWLEDYFGMPYPFAKLDLLAVPLTVGFGAMEHPGLITVNQRLVVARRADFTLGFQRAFAAVTAHELAHQWFGDLVTLAWWDDLWLNEAFASWLGDKVVQALHPGWDAGVQPVTRRASALDADALQTARRIRQPIQSTHDIENAFDRITYTKGAAVLTMFEHWLGAETFREGVRAYVRQHAWQNATAADFLAALSAVAGRDVATPFATFLEQVGAPFLTFTLACPPHQLPQLRLAQARYRPQGSQADLQGTWQVPVCVAYPAEDHLARACTVLRDQTAALELAETARCPAWVMPNAGGLGYYRSQLDGDLLVRLLDYGMSRLSLPERVSVIDDGQALVRAGTVEVTLALDLVTRYAGDDSRHLVTAVAGIVDGVRDVVPEDLRPNFARFIRTLFGARARQLGWAPAPEEDEDTRLLRTRLLRLVTDAGDDATLASDGRRLALTWLEHHEAVDPNLVEVALGAAARYGDHTLFERFYTAAKQATDRRDRQRLLNALASFRDPVLVQRALALVLSEEFDIREAMGLLFGGLAAPATRRLVYEFVKEQLDALLTKMPPQTGRSLVQVGVAQCDATLKAEIAAVFQDRISRLPGGPRVFAQALERLDLCAQQRETQRPGVVQFLRQY